MPVVIRLARKGHSHKPFYRITVADSRVAATGKFLDQIGYYDPAHTPPVVKVDEAGAIQWLNQGAVPSDTVRSLLHHQGIMEKAKLVSKGKATAASAAKPREWEKKKKPKIHKKAKAAAEKPAAAVAATAAPAAAAEAPAAA